MAACLGSSYVISHAASLSPHVGPAGEMVLPSDSVRYAAVAMFAVLGVPLAVSELLIIVCTTFSDSLF